MDEPINVLLVGDQGSGKSALVNSCYRVITMERNVDIAETRDTYSSTHTTTCYRKHIIRQDIKLQFFDIPGCRFNTPRQRDLLTKLLKGVYAPSIRLYTNDLDEEQMSQLKDCTDNKIHFVIFVIDASHLCKQEGFMQWLKGTGTVELPDTVDHYKKLFASLEIEGNSPLHSPPRAHSLSFSSLSLSSLTPSCSLALSCVSSL